MNASPSPSPGTTSNGLLERAKSRQPEAWRELVQTYSPLVYHWCRQSRLQPADAADVVQDVFHSLTTGLARYQANAEQGSFRAWLRTVTRNRLIDHYRRNARTIAPQGGSSNQDELAQVPDLEDVLPQEPADIQAKHDRVHRALEVLREEVTPQTWQVFWRTVIDGESPADVARELKMRPGTVYQAKSRGLGRLRQLLDGPSGPSS